MGINILISSCYIYSCGVVATKEEALFLKPYLDNIYNDLYAGEKTYEAGEKKLLQEAISFALNKANISKNDLDFLLGGDLSNQIYTSNSVASSFDVPFLGVYGACSTFVLALGLGAILIQNGIGKNILAFTSSNYGVAERQFRYPTTYGIEKKETVTSTVNGACAVILSNRKTKIKIKSVTFGRVIDSLSVNVNDMGSIMALSAFDTIQKHLRLKKEHCKDYDLILTGDLSKIGLKVLKDMLEVEKENTSMFLDAGEFIYKNKKDKHAGGSGPSCIALVGFSYILNEINLKHYHKVLYVATGSLHNKNSTFQNNTIPVIAHAIEIVRSEE